MFGGLQEKSLAFPTPLVCLSASCIYEGLLQCLSGKESACNAGATEEAGLIPGLGDPLEEGMTTHSSILAWRISWTQEPGEL